MKIFIYILENVFFGGLLLGILLPIKNQITKNNPSIKTLLNYLTVILTIILFLLIIIGVFVGWYH